MSNNDSNVVAAEHKANELPDGFDWLGIAKHFAKHTALELAKLQDAIQQVKRDEITQNYKSGFVQLDALGNKTVELKETTMSVVIQKQGGYLDGTTLQIGDLKFTYPSGLNTPYDSLNLLSLSQQIKISGTAGASYLIIESTMENVNPSTAIQGVKETQLTGSNTADSDTLPVTTTASALASHACIEVLIQNDPSSANNLLFGGPTKQTMVLTPGQSASVQVSNTDVVYVKSAGTSTCNYMWRQ